MLRLPCCFNLCSGDMFEAYAIETLRKGGTFRVQELFEATRPSTTWTLPASTLQVFGDASDLAALAPASSSAPTTFVPWAKNYTTVDFVLPGPLICNATIDMAHTLTLLGKSDTEGYIPVFKALTRTYPTAPVQFVWVMPDISQYNRQGKPFKVQLRTKAGAAGAEAAAGSSGAAAAGAASGGAGTGRGAIVAAPGTRTSASSIASRAKSALLAEDDALLAKFRDIQQFVLYLPVDVASVAGDAVASVASDDA